MKTLTEIFLSFIICLTASGTLNAGYLSREDSLLQEKFNKINLLIDVQQYAQALNELEELKTSLSPTTSKENYFKYQLVEVEIYKKTGNPNKALEIIESLPVFEDFPNLKLKLDFNHAAILVDFGNENFSEKKTKIIEIVERSKKTALLLSDFNMLGSFVLLEAVTYSDECHYLKINCEQNKLKSRELFEQSMQLFLENGDTNNYVNALSGYVRLVYAEPGINKDSLKKEMIKWLESNINLTNQINLYNQLADYALLDNDSLGYYRFRLGASEANGDLVVKNSDNHLKKMQVLYDLEKLEEAVKGGQKSLALQAEEIRTKNIRIRSNVIIIILCVFLVFAITFFFLRQKKLNNKLNASNKVLNSTLGNYQLLIKESNHRIKNNLQMILSILEFSKTGARTEVQESVTKIASKISIVTELHKLLNFQEHNEAVEFNSFFKKIIDSYTEINNSNLEVKTNIDFLELPSERMIYFGLILNELLSNTIEHRKKDNPVIVAIKKQENSVLWCFSYQDDSSFGEFEMSNGINLIEGLVKRLDGVDYFKDTKVGLYKFCFNV